MGPKLKSVKLSDLMYAQADTNIFIIKTDVEDMDCQV